MRRAYDYWQNQPGCYPTCQHTRQSAVRNNHAQRRNPRTATVASLHQLQPSNATYLPASMGSHKQQPTQNQYAHRNDTNHYLITLHKPTHCLQHRSCILHTQLYTQPTRRTCYTRPDKYLPKSPPTQKAPSYMIMQTRAGLPEKTQGPELLLLSDTKAYSSSKQTTQALSPTQTRNR